MAIILDDTVSGEYSNSYVDVAFSDDYFAADSDTTRSDTWSALGDDQKQRLLVQATYTIEALKFTYNSSYYEQNYEYDPHSSKVIRLNVTNDPVKYSVLQNLQFPRNFDLDLTTGVPFIPEAIKMAQCEQALYTKTFDATGISKALGGIKSEETEIAGQIRRAVTYTDGSAVSGSATVISGMSPTAVQLLSPFIARSTKVRRA